MTPLGTRNTGSWTIEGLLRSLTHEVDGRRHVAAVEVRDGTLTMYINDRIGSVDNPVLKEAQRLIGQRVVAEGDLVPWKGDWVRKPYWLSPNSVRPSE